MSVVKNCSWYQVDSRYCFQKYKSGLGNRKETKPKHISMPFLNVCVREWSLDTNGFILWLLSNWYHFMFIFIWHWKTNTYYLPYLIDIRLSFGNYMAFILSNPYFHQWCFICLTMLVSYCQIVLAVKWYFVNSTRQITATRCYFSNSKPTLCKALIRGLDDQ